MKKILGILGLILGAVAVYFGIMFAPEIKGAFLGNNTEPPTQDVEEPGEPTGDVVAGVQDSEALRLTKRNKVSANGQALDVTATLSPSTARDKTVSWSLTWASTNSNTVTDYVTITPSSDTLTCTVTVKKAFTTQIILACNSNESPSVKATCTIDYVSRKVTDNYSQDEWSEWDLGGENYADYTLQELFDVVGDDAITSASSYSLSNGSLKGTLKNIEITGGYLDQTNEKYEFDSQDYSTVSIEDIMTGGDLSKLYTAIDEINNSSSIINLTADVYYNETKICSVNFNVQFRLLLDSSYYRVTGITLNDTQLIF